MEDNRRSWIGWIALLAILGEICLFFSKKISGPRLIFLMVCTGLLYLLLDGLANMGRSVKSIARLNFQTAQALDSISQQQLAFSMAQERHEKREMVLTLIAVIVSVASVIELVLRFCGH